MRFRIGLIAVLLTAATFALASGGRATAQTPTGTPPTATGTAVALAPCPAAGGTLTVAAPTAGAPSTVTATIAPALANLKAASAADPTSLHVHYFIDTPAPAAGVVIPTGNPSIIHSGTLTQDLGTLAAGSHTVVVVVGQLDHRACDLRGQVTFTTAAAQAAPTAAVTPPKTGSGGLLGQTSEAASSGLGMAALAIATLVAAGGAAIATRRR